MGFWGFWAVSAQKPQSPERPNPFLWIYIWKTFLRRYSEFVGNLFSIFPSSLPDIQSSLRIFSAFFPSTLLDIRSSLEIFSAIFHLPQPTSKVRRISFLHFSIYLSRFQKFVGNLFINFPYTFPDILRSPKKFSAFFRYHRPISKVRRESFRQLSINTSRPSKFAGILCGNFPSYPDRQRGTRAATLLPRSPRIFSATLHPTPPAFTNQKH